MWRFNGFCYYFFYRIESISIHQMWRFNLDYEANGSANLISIHQMWRFNGMRYLICAHCVGFQYIKCGGSTLERVLSESGVLAISIHQMWRFNNKGNKIM